MKAAFTFVGRLTLALAVCTNVVFAQEQGQARMQAQAQAPSKPAEDCAGLAEAKARLEAQEKRLNDWPDAARDREANAKVAAPAEGEQRAGFIGASITDLWVPRWFGGVFPEAPELRRGISGNTTP